MNTIKSYTNLNKIIKFYFNWLKKNNQSFSPRTIKLLRKDLTVTILSLIWLDKKIEEVNQFQFNRYFLDAVNIGSLPPPNALIEYSKKNELGPLILSHTDNKITNNLSSIKDLGLYLIEQFNEHININTNSTKQWNLDRKNFFNDNGYVVIPDVMTSSECDDYRNTVINIAKDEKLNNNA